ncbi:MAG: hypothetical protein ACI4TK_06150, partial [Agathobacter sp.]
QIAGVGGEISGYNMFAYCFNNPVGMSDSTGNWPNWSFNFVYWFQKVVMPKTIGVATDVAEDCSNYDMHNESEAKVLESNYFSSYKGKIVIRTNFERSGSFGILFISRDAYKHKSPEDEVRHEYGHTKQLDKLGIINYTLCIGIPSAFEWGSDKVYYRRPWEITADRYGGVQSRRYPDYENAGYKYLKNSRMWGVFVWFTID